MCIIFFFHQPISLFRQFSRFFAKWGLIFARWGPFSPICFTMCLLQSVHRIGPFPCHTNVPSCPPSPTSPLPMQKQPHAPATQKPHPPPAHAPSHLAPVVPSSWPSAMNPRLQRPLLPETSHVKATKVSNLWFLFHQVGTHFRQAGTAGSLFRQAGVSF